MEDQSNGRHLRKGDTSLASKGFSWSTQSKGPKPVLWSLCCLGEARFSLLIFIAGRKWVHMRVVEEGMVTVSPGEGLNPPRRGRHSTWAASTRGGPGPAAERPETLTAPPTPSWNYTGAPEAEMGSHEGCGRGYGYRLPRGRAAERRCQLVISRKCSESKEVIHKIKMEMCLYWHRFTDIKMSTFPELFLIFFNVTLIYFCNYV